MKKNDVVVLTTIFQQDSSYSGEFFESLVHQTLQAFDLLVVNDGFSDLTTVRATYPSINIIEFSGLGNIAKNRELLVNWSIELGYSKAIFADFDDYFSSNRLATLAALLDVYDVVVNDLTLVVDNCVVCEKYLANSIRDRQEIALHDVLEFNFFGMSNTAIKLSGLRKVHFDEKLKAVDWFFFSTMLIEGSKAVFTNRCVTYYRQHEHNVANIGQLTSQQLLNEIAIKTTHYSLLIEFSKVYEPLLAGIKDFNQHVNTSVFTRYYQCVEKNKRPPFWWNIFNLNDYWRIKNETNR